MKTPARIGLVLFGVALVAVFVVIGGIVAFQVSYSGRALPGVHLQGVDVSGMQPEEIFRIAQTKAAYFRSPALTLHVPEKTVALRPADFGAGLDPAATTQRVLAVGRGGDLLSLLSDQLHIWWGGVEIAPVVVVDDQKARTVLDRLAADAQRAPQNAAVAYDPARGGVIETPAQSGVVLDVATSFALIQTAISAGKSVDLTLPVNAVTPDITSAAKAAEAARALFSQDVVIMLPKWDDADKPLPAVEAFRIRSADLPMFVGITQQVVNGEVQLKTVMHPEKIAAMLEKLAPAVQRDVQDARFTFDESAGELQSILPSQAGRTLNVSGTLDAIAAALNGAQRQVGLVVDTVQPVVSSDATAAKLGITHLITQATTYFKGSSAARMTNVKVAASRFNGVVVAPHETFSFDKYLGDVSTKDGFEEGLVIVGDRTIKGVGGGVCQVSTTAYQAALRAGFPIVERYPHGYRVGYYEVGMGPGFDATVFSPEVDLKFVNDTDAYMLIQTFFNQAAATLTFKYYGTPDNRVVTFTAPVITEKIAPGPDIYEKATDGSVAAGKVIKVDYAVTGAKIVAGRTVTRDGEVLIDEKLVSKYVPWQNVFRFGEGFTPPAGAIVR